MKLSSLGWRPSFEPALSELSNDTLHPARVFRQDKQRYLVHDSESLRPATLLGRLLYENTDASALPVVGDWVAIQPFDDDAIIHAVLPRFSAFYRKGAGETTRRQAVAANIDTVFLVNGLDNDFNVRRIERYLVQAAGSGARSVVVLNKTDLCPDLPAYIDEVNRIAAGIDVVSLSAKEEAGMDVLESYITEGSTVAFLGSSGVGKSSLVNRLLGEERLSTGSVREDDSRGRHTTTHRELVLLPNGGLVIDTPGMRELQLWGEEDDLQAVFADIEELTASCRFRDCRHESEPGCAVQEALNTGELDADRFISYSKLLRELAHLDRRQNELARQQAKKREKNFGKLIKQINKHNPKSN